MSKLSACFPLTVKLAPLSEAGQAKLEHVLGELTKSGEQFSSRVDAESGEPLIGGLSEAHLDGIVQHIVDAGLAIKVNQLQIAYRESISTKVIKDYTHKKLTAGHGQFARVVLVVEPNETYEGNTFAVTASDHSVPKKFVSGVAKGLETALISGVRIGAPVSSLKLTLVDGAFHDTDSSLIAFEIAARAAMREVLDEVGIVLEPVMSITVASPEEFVGSIVGDLNKRRGQIVSTELHVQSCIVRALVPIAGLLGYSVSLSSLSRGQASFASEFSHYQPTPGPDGPENFPPAIGMRA